MADQVFLSGYASYLHLMSSKDKRGQPKGMNLYEFVVISRKTMQKILIGQVEAPYKHIAERLIADEIRRRHIDVKRKCVVLINKIDTIGVEEIKF